MYKIATPANATTARPPTTLPAIMPVLFEPSPPEDWLPSLEGLDVGDGVETEVDGSLFDAAVVEASGCDATDVGFAVIHQQSIGCKFRATPHTVCRKLLVQSCRQQWMTPRPVAVDTSDCIRSTRGGEHDVRIAGSIFAIAVHLVSIVDLTRKSCAPTHQVLVRPPDPYTVV